MKMTVRKLAELAGVSPSTVSRALNDSPLIREETKAAIGKLVAEHGAPSVRTGRPASSFPLPVGCVIANPVGTLDSDQFFSGVLGGAITYLKRHNRQLLVEDVAGTPSPDQLPAIFAKGQVAGVIVGGIPISDSFIHALIARGLPTVFIGKYLDGSRALTSIIPDNLAGGELAGRHLLECGYTEFVFLGGSLDIQTFRDRLEGFRHALREGGKKLAAEGIYVAGIDQKGGYQAMARALERLGSHRLKREGNLDSRRVGVFASTDWMAAGALRALAEAGIAVPGCVGVVGYSDLELASHLYPSLTTVRVDRVSLGFLAARSLLDLVEKRVSRPVQIYIQPELIVRESTGAWDTNETN